MKVRLGFIHETMTCFLEAGSKSTFGLLGLSKVHRKPDSCLFQGGMDMF
jgi:hypothetical protein